MVSNLIINLNKIRAATHAAKAEKTVILFDYVALASTEGQARQRPLVRVIKDSLQCTEDGGWFFKGVNLYRINDQGKGISGAIRTFRLSRINGIVRQP